MGLRRALPILVYHHDHTGASDMTDTTTLYATAPAPTAHGCGGSAIQTAFPEIVAFTLT